MARRRPHYICASCRFPASLFSRIQTDQAEPFLRRDFLRSLRHRCRRWSATSTSRERIQLLKPCAPHHYPRWHTTIHRLFSMTPTTIPCHVVSPCNVRVQLVQPHIPCHTLRAALCIMRHCPPLVLRPTAVPSADRGTGRSRHITTRSTQYATSSRHWREAKAVGCSSVAFDATAGGYGRRLGQSRGSSSTKLIISAALRSHDGYGMSCDHSTRLRPAHSPSQHASSVLTHTTHPIPVLVIIPVPSHATHSSGCCRGIIAPGRLQSRPLVQIQKSLNCRNCRSCPRMSSRRCRRTTTARQYKSQYSCRCRRGHPRHIRGNRATANHHPYPRYLWASRKSRSERRNRVACYIPQIPLATLFLSMPWAISMFGTKTRDVGGLHKVQDILHCGDVEVGPRIGLGSWKIFVPQDRDSTHAGQLSSHTLVRIANRCS